MSLESELRAILPATDPATGDSVSLVPRHEFFRLLWGIIQPIENRFVSVEVIGLLDDLNLTYTERINRGYVRNYRDLNTDVGRAAFLECWWPAAADGACVAYTAQHGHEDGLPYPAHTLIRSASVTLRRTPTLGHQTIRFGVTSLTTVRGRAIWDLGIRREVWHMMPHFHEYLVAKGMVGRLTPMDPADPMRWWAAMPGPPFNHPLSFYLERPDRPITDSAPDWLRGTP